MDAARGDRFGPGDRKRFVRHHTFIAPQPVAPALLAGGECTVHGDGKQTRDFCHVANVVQANILAATSQNPAASGTAYNVALGGSTTLLELHDFIAQRTGSSRAPKLGVPRAGDIIHSSADIGKITRELGFAPAVDVARGLDETVAWYRTGF